MELPIIIPNETSKMTITFDDPNISFIVAFATLAIVGITLVGIILTNRNTKKSNDLLEIDLDTRLRPWLKLTEPLPAQMIFKNGKLMNWLKYNEMSGVKPFDDASKDKVRFVIEITNVGQSPTRRMVGEHMNSWEKFSRDDLIEKGEKHDPRPLMPNETTKFTFDMPFQDYVQLDTKHQYVGYFIEYNVHKNKTEQIGKIWEMEKGFSEIIDHWL